MKTKVKKVDKNRLIEGWDSEDLCLRCDGQVYSSGLNKCRGRFYNKKSKFKSNDRVDIYLVGEAPGDEELFFTGPVGSELQRWIRSAGINNYTIYLDNVIRCQPVCALNKMVTATANKLIRNCRPYIFDELVLYRPRVIVPMGNVALKSIMDLSGIYRWRGRILISRSLNAYVIPTFDPGEVIDGHPEWADMAIEDFELAGKYAKSVLKLSRLQTKVVETENDFRKCLTELKSKGEFVVDIETTGLKAMDPSNKIIGICLSCSKSKGYFIPCLQNDGEMWIENEIIKKSWMVELRKLFESEKYLKIFHYSTFDLLWFRRLGWQVKNIYDTIIANRLIDDIDNDLKSLAYIYTDFGGYEKEIESFKGNKDSGFLGIPPKLLSKYGAYDAIATWRLRNGQKSKLTNKLKKVLQLQHELRLNLTDMEFYGIRIDKKQVKKLRSEYLIIIEKAKRDLIKMTGQKDLNVNSSKQLLELFYGKKFGYGSKAGIYSENPAGRNRKFSTDAKTLEYIKRKYKAKPESKEFKFADALGKYRLYNKRISTYIDVFEELSKFDGNVRTNFNQHIAVTGRLSSSGGINLQNQPREKEMRNCYIAQSGYELVELDYSQLEIRIAAIYSKDENMLRVLNNNGDIHVFVGHNSIYDENDVPYNDPMIFKNDTEMRAKAKITGFSVIYGKGAKTLAEDLNVSVARAEKIINLLLNETFPGLGAWIKWQHSFVLRNGFIETLFGRKIFIPGWNSTNLFDREKALRCAVNYPIQSAASDCVVTGINRVCKRIKKEKFPAIPRLTVHDSLLVDVQKGHTKEFIQMARHELQRPVSGVSGVILRVDAKFGKRWGDMKEVVDKLN